MYLFIKFSFIIYLSHSHYIESTSKVDDHSRGRLEGSLSIATTLRCREGCDSFPWIALLYPSYVPYCWVLSKEVSSTNFNIFGMTRPGIEPRSPGPLANILPTTPMSQNVKYKWVLFSWSHCQFLIYNQTKLYL